MSTTTDCPGPDYVFGRIQCPDDKPGCLVIHHGWIRKTRSVEERLDDLERAAQQPALTGGQVRAVFNAEWGVDARGTGEEVWERVAARLSKP